MPRGTSVAEQVDEEEDEGVQLSRIIPRLAYIAIRPRLSQPQSLKKDDHKKRASLSRLLAVTVPKARQSSSRRPGKKIPPKEKSPRRSSRIFARASQKKMGGAASASPGKLIYSRLYLV